MVLGGAESPSLRGAHPFILANRRGRKEARGANLDLIPQGPRLCSGYDVITATRSVQDSSNVDGLRHASRGEPATGRGAARRPRSSRTAPPPRARSRVLTWSAQVGLGRGRRLARRRGTGASPLPTSEAGAHLGDSKRKPSLGSASPGNTGGPAGRQEAAAEVELD